MSNNGNHHVEMDTITYSVCERPSQGTKLTFRDKYNQKKKERNMQKQFSAKSRNSKPGMETVRVKP